MLNGALLHLIHHVSAEMWWNGLSSITVTWHHSLVGHVTATAAAVIEEFLLLAAWRKLAVVEGVTRVAEVVVGKTLALLMMPSASSAEELSLRRWRSWSSKSHPMSTKVVILVVVELTGGVTIAIVHVLRVLHAVVGHVAIVVGREATITPGRIVGSLHHATGLLETIEISHHCRLLTHRSGTIARMMLG